MHFKRTNVEGEWLTIPKQNAQCPAVRRGIMHFKRTNVAGEWLTIPKQNAQCPAVKAGARKTVSVPVDHPAGTVLVYISVT